MQLSVPNLVHVKTNTQISKSVRWLLENCSNLHISKTCIRPGQLNMLDCKTHQWRSKIEKVPRGSQGEKSRKIWQVEQIWSVQLEHKQVPKRGGGRNQMSGRVNVPSWHATPVANAPWKTLTIRWRSTSESRSWNGWKVWSVEKSLLVKDHNFISWEGDFILLNKIPVSTILTKNGTRHVHVLHYLPWLEKRGIAPMRVSSSMYTNIYWRTLSLKLWIKNRNLVFIFTLLVCFARYWLWASIKDLYFLDMLFH